MKRILFLISILAVLFINGYSQEKSPQDKALDYDASWFTYTAHATTYATTATDSNWYFTTLKESHGPVKYDVKLSLDSISGTQSAVAIVIKGKKFASDDFTPIDTITWALGSDTTIVFTQNTTALFYRYFVIDITTALKGFIIQVDELSEKFWE
jgi:hypothetical protein